MGIQPTSKFCTFYKQIRKKGGQITALCWVYQQSSLKSVSTEIWPPYSSDNQQSFLNHSSPEVLKILIPRNSMQLV